MEIKAFMKKLSTDKGVSDISLIRSNVVKINLERDNCKDFVT